MTNFNLENLSEIIDEVLVEFCETYPIPNFDNKEQLEHLRSVLQQFGAATLTDKQLMEAISLAPKKFTLEAPTKKTGKPDIDKILKQKIKNTDTGRDITVASALNYKDQKGTGARQAYHQAVGMLKASGYSEKDVDMVDDPNPEEPKYYAKPKQPKIDPTATPANLKKLHTLQKAVDKKNQAKATNTTKNTNSNNKSSRQGLALSKEESHRMSYDKNTLVNIVKSGLIPTKEKILSGAGAFDATDDEMKSLLEVTQKQVEDPNYRLPLPKYDVSEQDIDTAVDEMKKLLGKEFSRIKTTIQKAGGVDPQLTTGERGVKRFRDIIKLYLQTGGRSAVTGKIVPFNQMQLDHHVPYSSAAKIVADKKKKGIKTTLLDEQARLDSLPNWDLMETSLNQLKNSLEGNELIAKINKKLSASPEERELKKITQEVQNIREASLLKNLVKSFGKGDFSGMNEKTIENMSGDEIDIVMKAWNWWHPNTGDANQFRKIDPNYDNTLKKAGIKVPPPDDPNTIIRNTSQVGGSRSRGVKRPVPERKKLTIKAMKGAKSLVSKKEAAASDSVLLKAVQQVEKEVKPHLSKIDQLKQKIKQQGKK